MAEKTTIKHKKPKPAEKRRELIPCLVVVEGNSLGETFFISKSSITIGRDEKSDLFLPEDGVSRTHARIDVHEHAHTLTDLGSTNGTYVNGSPTEQATLHEGDKIRMGEVVLRYSFQDMMDVDYQAKLRNMAMRDGLTKLFNQKYFTDSLSREINFATRKREPLTLIMVDIDHFKNVNETYGHPAGDHVLRS